MGSGGGGGGGTGSRGSSSGESELSFGSFGAAPMRVSNFPSNESATVLRDIWKSPPPHDEQGRRGDRTGSGGYDDDEVETGFGVFDSDHERPKGVGAGSATRLKTKRKPTTNKQINGQSSSSSITEEFQKKSSRNTDVNTKMKKKTTRRNNEDEFLRDGASSTPPPDVGDQDMRRPSHPKETKRNGRYGNHGSRLFNPEKTLTTREFTEQQSAGGGGGGGGDGGGSKESRPKGAMSGQLRKIDFLQSFERASSMGSASIRAAAMEEVDDPRMLRYSKSAGLPSVATPSKQARLPPLQSGSPLDHRTSIRPIRVINSAPSAVFHSLQTLPPNRPVDLDPFRSSAPAIPSMLKPPGK